jgi:hypothetical protein
VVNTYSIYAKDIKPKGFAVVELDGYVTEDAVTKTKQVLADSKLRQEMVEQSYELGRKYFSYEVLRRRLKAAMIEQPWMF